MTDILLLKFAHLLCLVYWLGGDLGVFYTSFTVANNKFSTETRIQAAKILFALDQAPRICMTLILPTGAHLGYRLGVLDISGGTVLLIWIICLLWLCMVLVLHFRGHNQALTTFDFWFRIVLASFLLGVSVWGLAQTKIILANWLAIKLVVFAVLMFFGLLIRIKLKPFGPAFAQMAQGQATDSVNHTIQSSLASVRPFVLGIWLGLLLNTALGIHLISV